jgi:hypothetical protein
MTISWVNPDGTFNRMSSDDGIGPDGTVKVEKDPPHGQAIWDFTTKTWSDPNKPMREWEEAMAEAKRDLPDYAEDIFDGMNPSDQANVPKRTKDRVAAKKTLRGQKP